MAKYNAHKHCIESDDGHHLATLNPAIRGDDVIVPTAAIGPAAEMLERVENVEVAMADACGILIRAADGEEFFSKCIEGRYPAYQQVIPRGDQTVRARVRVADLRRAIEWAKVMWAKVVYAGDRTTKIEIEGETMRLTTFVPEKGESVEQVELLGPVACRAVFAVPVHNLAGMLGHEGEEEVSLETTPESNGTVASPVLYRDGAKFLGVMMPMRVVDAVTTK